MPVSERERMALYRAIQEHLGIESADTFMELLPPTGWGDVATRNDLRMTATELRGEMAEVRGEMAEVRGEIAEVRGEIAEVRGEIAELRGEMRELFADAHRSTVLWLAVFALTTWIAMLTSAFVG
jgi:hypothetical protein